jgi:hypothetical protein
MGHNMGLSRHVVTTKPVRAALLRAAAGRARFMGHNVGLSPHLVTTKPPSLCAPAPRWRISIQASEASGRGATRIGHRRPAEGPSERRAGVGAHFLTCGKGWSYRVLFDGSGSSHLAILDRARFSEDEPARCGEPRVPTLVSKQ